MDLLEQRALVDLLIKEIKAEQNENDLMAQPEINNEHKKDSTRENK